MQSSPVRLILGVSLIAGLGSAAGCSDDKSSDTNGGASGAGASGAGGATGGASGSGGTSTGGTSGSGGTSTGGTSGSGGTSTGGTSGSGGTSTGGTAGSGGTSTGGTSGSGANAGSGGMPPECTVGADDCPAGYECACGGPGPVAICTCHKQCQSAEDCSAPESLCGCTEGAPRICVSNCFCFCD